MDEIIRGPFGTLSFYNFTTGQFEYTESFRPLNYKDLLPQPAHQYFNLMSQMDNSPEEAAIKTMKAWLSAGKESG